MKSIQVAGPILFFIPRRTTNRTTRRNGISTEKEKTPRMNSCMNSFFLFGCCFSARQIVPGFVSCHVADRHQACSRKRRPIHSFIHSFMLLADVMAAYSGESH